jgi:hypothetical protein
MSGVNYSARLGPYLGWRGVDFDQMMRRWSSAGVAARRAGPKCEAVSNSTGQCCQASPVRGSCYCVAHNRGSFVKVSEDLLLAAHRKTLSYGDIPSRETRARAGLAKIAKSQLQRLWGFKADGNALAPGSTLSLEPPHEAEVREWLRTACGVDLDAGCDPETGREFTPRFIDRTRNSAWRVVKRRNSHDPEFESLIRGRIANMLKSERDWWEKYDRLGGDVG